MSAKEVDRLHWMRLLAERRTTQRQAAEALGLTARHLRRLYAAFQAAGAPGLVSKRRGKRSNRAAPDAMREQVVGIVRTRYADFGPTLDTICANSPAAKGRVERAHQMLQDRLVKELRLSGIGTRKAANAYATEFMADYNRRFARPPLSAHNAHRPMLPTEKLEQVFTWQEERRLTQNLTLHYKRVLYLVEPNEYARSAAGRQVLVRETHDGEVMIEHKGVALSARAFAKDARVEQAAIVDNKLLSAALLEVRTRQTERAAETLAKKRLTLREEDLMRNSMGVEPLSTRRPGRPTLRELALARQAAGQTKAAGASGVDQLVAETVARLAVTPSASAKARSARGTRTKDWTRDAR